MMNQNIDNDVYSRYYNAISIHIPWLKGVIKRNRKFIISVGDLHNYFGGMEGDPEIIYQTLNKILSDEGILVSMGTGSHGMEYFSFNLSDINLINRQKEEIRQNEENIHDIYRQNEENIHDIQEKEKNIHDIHREKEKNIHTFLENNKLYDEKTKFLLCPECYRYTVQYSVSSYNKSDKKWWCNYCLDSIIYPDYHLDINDKDKYHIYKLWGADALSIFTNQHIKKIVKFVAEYFKSCCVTKKDKCLYFDFFKEKDSKEDGKIRFSIDTTGKRE